MARYESGGAGRWIALAVIAALCQVVLLRPPVMAQEGNLSMQLRAEIRELIQDISGLRQLDAASLGELFHVRLDHMGDGGNPYIAIFMASVPEPSPVQKLELRVPSAKNPNGSSLLILTMRSKSPFSIHEARTAFGPPAEVQLPRAAAPFGTPTYESYFYDWGKLTFGYLPAQQEQVTQIIFDRK